MKWLCKILPHRWRSNGSRTIAVTDERRFTYACQRQCLRCRAIEHRKRRLGPWRPGYEWQTLATWTLPAEPEAPEGER